jgi:hypothetical protein
MSIWLAASALERAGRLALCVVGGAVSYFAVLFVLGVRPGSLRGARGKSAPDRL